MSLVLALVQEHFRVGAVDANAARIIQRIREARDAHGAHLVVFPELAISGYPPEDLLLRPAFLAACEAALERVAAACTGITAVVGWPQAAGAVVFNAASVLRDGAIEATYRKRELPNYAVFDERRYFAAGDEDLVVEVEGVPVGVLVCEDLWFPEPVAATARAGARLVVVPNASPFERAKRAERDALLAERASTAGVGLAYLNLVGGQDELVFDGASTLADADGRVHPAALAFEDQLLVATFDAASGRFTPRAWPAEPAPAEDALAWRAIVRGTRDYLRHNGFNTAWLGLSGGVDSAMVLAIAVDALGADNVTAVRLPSRYTADLSNDLAAEQCAALGVRLETVPIEGPFAGFLDALAPVFAGRPADLAEENLQSRCRGAIMMALANKLGGMLLTTGNKSEYAVGYATIYGDMCGGYAPLKDLYKTEVWALCRWRNAWRPAGTAPPIPPAVIERPPSAELREGQLDQDSLPPYELLDALLRAHVDEEASREELLERGFEPAVVDQVLRLVRLGEWKRRQAAPGPKVSRRAFGRERRYPITSGWMG